MWEIFNAFFSSFNFLGFGGLDILAIVLSIVFANVIGRDLRQKLEVMLVFSLTASVTMFAGLNYISGWLIAYVIILLIVIIMNHSEDNS